jgi:hypothetical protein
MSLQKIKELALRRFNLIQEVHNINAQLLVQYEGLMIAATKGQLDVKALENLLSDRDATVLKRSMPNISEMTPPQQPVQHEHSPQSIQRSAGVQQDEVSPQSIQRSAGVQYEVSPQSIQRSAGVQYEVSPQSAPIENTSLTEPAVIDSSNVRPVKSNQDDDDDIDDKAPSPTWDEQIQQIKRSENYLKSVQTNADNLNKVRNTFMQKTEDQKVDYRTKNVPILTAELLKYKKIDVSKDPKLAVATELNIQFYKDYLLCITAK